MARDRRTDQGDDSNATTHTAEVGVTRPTVDHDPASPVWGTPGRQRASRPLGAESTDHFGRYQIEGQIASGGMGTVFAARDPQLNRRVALKRVRIHGSERRVARARLRLQREAQAMAKLSHPNVITVYDVGVTDDGDLFVALELVEGETLRHWLEGQRSLAEILEMFTQAGRGLAAAHRAGIVHRDFKPDNVMVGADDRVRVLDFGLARAAEPDDDSISRRHSRPGSMGDYVEAVQAGEDDSGPNDALRVPITTAGTIMGTPLYMAPEQHLGRSADATSDQFSFCVALYQALYDKHPFGETHDEIRAAVVGGKLRPAPKDSDVPERIFKLLARGMHLRAGQRFSSMNGLLAALEGVTTAGPSRSRSWLIPLGVILVLAGLGAGAWVTYQKGYWKDYLAQVVPTRAACPDGAEAMAGIWDPETRETIRQAFDKNGSAIAGSTFQRVEALLDSYSRSWVSLQGEACERTREISEIDYRVQESCLMRRRERLRGLVMQLQTGDTRIIESAVPKCEALPPIDVCADIESLRLGVQPPGDETRVQVEALRRELGELESLSESPGTEVSPAQMVERARDAVEKARALAYPPILAESLIWLGAAQSRGDLVQESRKTLEEAVLVAEECGYREALARSLVELAHVVSAFSSDEIDVLDRRARAAITRYDENDIELTGRLDVIRANRLAAEGDVKTAVEIAQAAIARYRESGRSQPLRLAHSLDLLAGWYIELGRHDDAIACSQESLTLCQEQLGLDHPGVVKATEKHAEFLRQAGQYDEARAAMNAIAGFWTTPRGAEIAATWASGRSEPAAGPRSLTVRIVDSRGKPVPGADVVIGTALLPDGKYLVGAYSFAARARHLQVRGTADEQGELTLEGPWDGLELVAAAEKDELGRSLPVVISAKKRARDRIRIRLAPWGRLEGTIAITGPKPGAIAARVMPWDAPDAGEPGPMTIQTREDGSYVVERLPAGRYSVQALASSGSSGSRVIRIEPIQVRIRPERTVRGDVSIDGEGIALKVELAAPAAGLIEDTLTLLTPGRWRPRTLDRALRELPARLKRYGLIQSTSSGDGPIVLTGVEPGSYTLCVEPVRGDVRDPDSMRALLTRSEPIEMHCESLRVKREPAEQTVTVTIETLQPPREPAGP